MLPAAGQGALGIEVRSDRQDLLDLFAGLADQGTWQTVTAERAVSRCMGGSCSMPLAAHGEWQGEQLWLRAAWGDEINPNAPLVSAQASAAVTDLASADALGQHVASLLQQAGAQVRR
jgi:hydroxymethylbilane synthase